MYILLTIFNENKNVINKNLRSKKLKFFIEDLNVELILKVFFKEDNFSDKRDIVFYRINKSNNCFFCLYFKYIYKLR